MEIQEILQNATDMHCNQYKELRKSNPDKEYIKNLEVSIAKLQDEIQALGFEIKYNIFVGYYAKKDNITIFRHEVVVE